MDIEKLELLAYDGAEMPDGLKIGEQLLFLTLRELYSNFRAGAVNRERGHREKQRIMVAYQQIAFEQKVSEEHTKIRRRLESEIGSLHKCDCPTCRQVARVFDGIDRREIPEDIKELQEWNEKLRELVKQRSERSAELANIIDGVRRALADDKLSDAGKVSKIAQILS